MPKADMPNGPDLRLPITGTATYSRPATAGMTKRKFSTLPGFGLTMGYTLLYLSVVGRPRLRT